MTAAYSEAYRISIAPMMDYTDKHFRYLLRLITQQTLLYTEMITTDAILHGNAERLLNYHGNEHPLALQLGGSDPIALEKCARIAEAYGYDEVNLNVGCPSNRVQKGRFGACLMKEPALVADCVAAMKEAVMIPVTVKTRLGVDEEDSDEKLYYFIESVAKAGCDTVVLHARKAWLSGLSPKENRNIPPLNYDRVYQVKQCFPHLKIILNGGIQTVEQIQAQLSQVDGVMIGRQACTHPFLFHEVDQLFFNQSKDSRLLSKSRADIVRNFIPYIQSQLAQGVRLNTVARHLLGLYYGTPGARMWRRFLSENMYQSNAGIEVIERASSFLFGEDKFVPSQGILRCARSYEREILGHAPSSRAQRDLPSVAPSSRA